MTLKKHILLTTSLVLSAGFQSSFAFSFMHPFQATPHVVMTGKVQSEVHRITAQTDNLSPTVVALGLTAYEHARTRGLDNKKMLTIIDYSKPSTERRMWVINLANDRVLFNTLVAHGKNSGDNYATHFSNDPSSEQSSLGVFLTGNTYVDKHGTAMRLIGLESGFNSNAYKRAIVMHGANYVNDSIGNQLGRLGKSWGCPALDPKIEPRVVNTIKNGTLIFAYYPSHQYLTRSQFMKPVGNGATLAA